MPYFLLCFHSNRNVVEQNLTTFANRPEFVTGYKREVPGKEKKPSMIPARQKTA